LLTTDNRVLEVAYTRVRRGGVVELAVREAGHAHTRCMGVSEWVALHAAFRRRVTTAIGGIGPYENLFYDEASGGVLILHRPDTTCRWVCAAEWAATVVHQRRAHLPVRGARPRPRPIIDPYNPTPIMCVFQADGMKLWMDACTLELAWACNDEGWHAGGTFYHGGTGSACL
jgi:hypothetical protein